MKFIKLLMVIMPFASYAQVAPAKKVTVPEYSEMTYLEQFGGPSIGTYNPNIR